VSLETDLRLTLDYPEDYELLKIIAQKFTFAEKRLEIEKFLIENLTFRQINLFRNKDFLQNKEDTKIVEFG
jgi:spore coat polysaccharide biosynthesis protein SpsF (cytidylyltransferase family)